jgi:hypothetical protein
MRSRSHVPPGARWWPRAAAALALCALLGGCGGGRSTGHAHPATASRSPRGATAPTRSQALAFAHAVNLTAGDVPGFSPSPRHETETEQERRLRRQLRRCAGAARFGSALAEEQSPSFKLRRGLIDLGVSSEVAVSGTPELAARELAAIRGARVKRCFARYLNFLLKGQRRGGARLRPVSIATGTPPAPGAQASFGWRITASFMLRGISFSLYVDMLGFELGPARVTLVSSGALRPFPAPIQQRLFMLLLARARARAL